MTPHDELEELLGAYAVCFGRPILRKKLHALLDRQQAKIDALDRARADAARLDWLEQLVIPSEQINDLVRNWRVNGKRYPEGIRAAIDAAINVQGVDT